MASVWDDPDWIASELSRVSEQGGRWGFTVARLRYLADLTARAAQLARAVPGAVPGAVPSRAVPARAH